MMTQDPAKKLMCVTIAQLAAIHASVIMSGTKSPLNPILGETGYYTTESGAKLYCEQTSHHPPISHYHCIGPPECPYEMYGHVQYSVNIHGMCTYVTADCPGKSTLVLPDKHNSKYEI